MAFSSSILHPIPKAVSVGKITIPPSLKTLIASLMYAFISFPCHAEFISASRLLMNQILKQVQDDTIVILLLSSSKYSNLIFHLLRPLDSYNVFRIFNNFLNS